jgi:serine/threonine protein kinase
MEPGAPGFINDSHFIAAEFIDGPTLRQRLRSGAAPLSEALDVAIQVASALADAHAVGIVRRDIKPENIMLRRDGYVKVLDFGLAKLIEPPSTEQTSINSEDTSPSDFHTDPGIMMGTPRYMSPEQIRGMQVDARADIFSLGVVIYEMMAGRTPFDGGSAGEVVAAILNDEPTPLERCVREAPAELARIVRKALAKDREQRYQTAKGLLMGLKNLNLELELADRFKQTGLGVTLYEAGERQPTDEDAIRTLPRSKIAKMIPHSRVSSRFKLPYALLARASAPQALE